jgi:polyphenol oxidase
MRWSKFKVNQSLSIKWLSFSALEDYDFILHGFIIKNSNHPINNKTKEIENLLQTMAPTKRMLISPRQMHQDECVIINKKDKLMRRYSGDALLTNRKDIFISVQVADCVPIFLVDDKRKVIGLIHAGWKGTLLGIVSRTMEKAIVQFGCKSEDFTILFGPCIRSCCYQVSDDVAILFDRKCVKRSPDGGFMLDLICANRKQFLNYGVKEKRMWATRNCTFCDEEMFHSYRREKTNAGKMIAFLGLK